MDVETFKIKCREFLADADGKAKPGMFEYLRAWLQAHGYAKVTEVIPSQQEALLQHLAAFNDQSSGVIRTITRRELVPGNYGRIRVTGLSTDPCKVDLVMIGRETLWTSQELRDSAKVMLEIADFMDDRDEL